MALDADRAAATPTTGSDDPKWQRLTLTAAYPKARFFSFAVYDNAPVSTGLADRLFDAQIVPDPGSGNPFAPDPTYTITVTRSAGPTGNVLQLHAETGWLLYRLYLPDAGGTSMGGVPLPEVRITDANGSTTPLPTCQFINRQSELVTLQEQFVPAELETPPIVIRGKGPAFPDTYHGSSVWDPAPGFDAVQMRFWSICLADLVSPLPVEGCAVDASTPLDRKGYYTIVISNDVLRPAWLPAQVVWLPWGDEQMVPKLIFVRHLLPSPDFKNAVQNAVDQGCGIAFNFPTTLTQEEITTSGQCAQQVMGDYYPVAVWCDVQTFKAGGVRACLRPARVR